MRMIAELPLKKFRARGGAIDTKKAIIAAGKAREFETLITVSFPEGITYAQLNNLLQFESEWIYKYLGIEAW